MKLPNGERAIIDDEKLLRYILSPLHREGRKHADLFKRLLGVDLTKVELLRTALLDAATQGEAWPGKTSTYGRKYEIRFPMTSDRGTYIILSIWMIRSGETDPRLVTAYVE